MRAFFTLHPTRLDYIAVAVLTVVIFLLECA
jgi:hypothetical protein